MAASALGKLGDIEPLLEMLSDKDWRTRQAVARLLGQTGDQKAVEPLLELLSDENDSVRHIAIESLGSLGDARAIEPLCNLLATLSDELYMRRSTLSALGNLGVIEPLLTELAHGDYGERGIASDVLGKMKDGRAVKPLIHALSDGVDSVRRRAARALGMLEDVRAVEPLMMLALSDRDYDVSSAAATALGRIKAPNITELFIEGLRNPAPERLTEITRNMRDAVDIEPLLNALDGAHYLMRKNIALALGGMEDERALPALINLLSDESDLVRANATSALENLSFPENVDDTNITDVLINALSDSDDAVRSHIASALGKLISPRAVEPLIKVLFDKGEDNPEIKVAAAIALGQLGDKRAVEALIKALFEEPDTRWVAISSLEKLRDNRAVEPLIQNQAVEPLIQFVRSHERFGPHVCEWAIEAIVRLGDARIVAPLMEILPRIYDSTDERERMLPYKIAIALMKMGCCEPLVFSVVMSWLLDDAQNNCINSILTLKEVNNPRSIESFVHFLCSEENVNQLIEMILGQAGSNLLIRFLREIPPMAGKSAERLIKALQVPLNTALTKADSWDRVHIACLLTRIEDAKGMEILIQTLHTERGFTHYLAAEALAELGDLRAVEPLISVLTSQRRYGHSIRNEGYNEVRPHVAGLLGELGDLRALQPLIGVLSDEYDGLRCKAAYGLGELGDDRAILYLEKALEDESESARDAAREAIEKLKSPHEDT